jgi:hypothetical protein
VHRYQSNKRAFPFLIERKPGGPLLLSTEGHVFRAYRPLPPFASSYSFHADRCKAA